MGRSFVFSRGREETRPGDSFFFFFFWLFLAIDSPDRT